MDGDNIQQDLAPQNNDTEVEIDAEPINLDSLQENDLEINPNDEVPVQETPKITETKTIKEPLKDIAGDNEPTQR